eukprot:114197-Pyramimonas_sp.AAC.1
MSTAGARVKFQIWSRHFHDGPVRMTRVPRTRVLRLPQNTRGAVEGQGRRKAAAPRPSARAAACWEASPGFVGPGSGRA